MEINQQPISKTPNLESYLKLTHVLYGLQAFAVIFGVTYLLMIIAVIINYVKLPEIKGTWLESHFIWQIRTFWFGLLWLVVGIITIPFLVGLIILLISYIWLIYRVIRGWVMLADGKEVKPIAL